MGKKADWKQIAETFEFIKTWRAPEVYPFFPEWVFVVLLFAGFLSIFFKVYHPTFIIRKELKYLNEIFI